MTATDAHDREIDLKYECGECGKKCHVTSEKELFLIVSSQSCAENEELLCGDCND